MQTDSLKRRTLGAAACLALAAGVALATVGVPTQQARLTADDGAVGDHFGVSVAVEGDSVVAGAYQASAFAGAAYVDTRTGTAWSQQAKLVPDDAAAGDFFGGSVSISGDTAIIGALGKGSQAGAAYVFMRSGTVWSQQQKLVAGDPAAGDDFGFSVAVEGDTAIVGAEAKGSGAGAAYVFTRSGTVWAQQQKLVPTDPAAGDGFGYSVALSGDTAVVAANAKDSSTGAAYVFTRAGTVWSQQQELTADDAALGDDFGESVTVDGDTAIVGAKDRSSSQGAAYVFTRSAGTWTQQQQLTAADAADGDDFGVSADLQGDTVVLGAWDKAASRGAAYVFTRSGTTWTQQHELTALDAVDGDTFGVSVSLDGDTVVAGADGDKNGAAGAAYVFDLLGSPGYCLPLKIKAKANAAHPEKSTLTASGTLDTGAGVPDFSGAATFDVGGFHLDVPAFVAKGKSLKFDADGITLTITPAKNGSSRAAFSAKVVGDLTGKVGLDAPLGFHFGNAASDLDGTATLVAGALGPHGVTAPTLWLLKAAATIKGGGKDSLKLTLGFATDGSVPGAAEDLTLGFGDNFLVSLDAGTFAAKGNSFVHSAKAPGITKATVDYAKGTITIAGAGLDLGAFADGGNAVTVTVTLGADTRSASVRMVRAGAKLAY